MANQAYADRHQLPDGRYAVDIDSAKTLAAEDSGLVQNVVATGVTITLPAVATQGYWTIRDGGVPETDGPDGAIVSASVVTVDPNASDTLAGLNQEGTEQDGKYFKNTAGDPGDEITILNTGATNGGLVGPTIGDWLAEG